MSRLLRTRSRPVALLALVLGLMLLAPVPASAGGPTSVLISSPSTENTASLYVTDEDYELLFDALGGENPEGVPGAPENGAVPGPGGSQVNVTWLRHDVHVWRVNRIVTDDDGEVWVHTNGTVSEPFDHGSDSGVWHRPPRPEQLRDLLDRLGVSWSGSSASASGDDRISSVTSSPTSPWAWVLPGVIAGAFLGVVADRRLRPRRAQPAGEDHSITG